MKEIVRIKNKAIAPSYFEWTVKVAPGCTIEVQQNVLTMINDRGRERIKTFSPWGEDSATTAQTDNGKQFIRCTLTLQGTRNGLPVVRLTPNPDDMASAIGTVRLDPTTYITGTAAIKECYIWAYYGNNNYGGSTVNYVDNNTVRHGLWRVETVALPIGTYTEVRWNYTLSEASVSVHTYRLTSAFIEGSSHHTPEVGASCWNKQVYNTVPWAGGAKFGWSDYDSSTEMGATTGGSGAQVTTYNAAGLAVWQGWESGAYTNNGFALYGFGAGGIFTPRPSEYTAAPPTFEIDVEAAISSPKFFFIGF